MIEVKITGNSIPELADKLTAMGRALHAQASYDADNAAREALQAQCDAAAEAEKPKAKRAVKKAEPEAAPVTIIEDAPEETAAGVPEREEIAPSPPTETPEVTEREDVPALETVTAAVLSAVERVGRDKVVAILAQFGVNRASEVAPAQRAELLAMVKDA